MKKLIPPAGAIGKLIISLPRAFELLIKARAEYELMRQNFEKWELKASANEFTKLRDEVEAMLIEAGYTEEVTQVKK